MLDPNGAQSCGEVFTGPLDVGGHRPFEGILPQSRPTGPPKEVTATGENTETAIAGTRQPYAEAGWRL